MHQVVLPPRAALVRGVRMSTDAVWSAIRQRSRMTCRSWGPNGGSGCIMTSVRSAAVCPVRLEPADGGDGLGCVDRQPVESVLGEVNALGLPEGSLEGFVDQPIECCSRPGPPPLGAGDDRDVIHKE